MAKESAGLLVYRRREGWLEFLLVHPGGPFWKNKDNGAWTIPKGEVEAGEDALATAKREFEEELGLAVRGEFVQLAPIKQKGGKLVRAWAVECDLDVTDFKSNTFEMEWPLRSGRTADFPEVDQVGYFEFETAKTKVNAAQIELLQQVIALRNKG
jgi:predicted NUDIX family NTP pyrophosphohydrolase